MFVELKRSSSGSGLWAGSCKVACPGHHKSLCPLFRVPWGSGPGQVHYWAEQLKSAFLRLRALSKTSESCSFLISGPSAGELTCLKAAASHGLAGTGVATSLLFALWRDRSELCLPESSCGIQLPVPTLLVAPECALDDLHPLPPP